MRKMGMADDGGRPAGLSDRPDRRSTDKAPAAIAASVAAQVLIAREALHGARDEPAITRRIGRAMADAALATAPALEMPRAAGRAAAARGGRHHQALRRLRRQRCHQSRNLARRGARAARRERRRQVHAGEDDLRPAAAERGRIPLAGRAGRARRPGGGARARHRHGVPAFQPVRAADRRRERRARPRQRAARRHRRARRRRLEQPMACRSIPSARCGGSRSASASASRSCAACCRIRSC